MTLTLDRHAFVPALRTAASLLPKRYDSPKCNMVRLVATPDSALLIAWHRKLDVTLTLSLVGFRVTGGFMANVQPTWLANLVEAISDQEVQVACEGGEGLVLRSCGGTFRFPWQDQEEDLGLEVVRQAVAIERWAEAETGSYFEIPAEHLLGALRRTTFAAAVDDPGRYPLNGVLLELGTGELPHAPQRARLVATDGRRLSIAETPARRHGDLADARVLPLLAARLLERLLSPACEAGDVDPAGGPASIHLRVDGQHLHVAAGRATLSARFLEGRYPPWHEVIPKPGRVKHTFALPVKPLLAALRQQSLWSDEEHRGVALTFGADRLTLQAKHREFGTAESVVTAPGVTPVDQEFSFQAKLLIELLSVEGLEQVELHLVDANSAAMFVCGRDFRHVLMPLTRYECHR